MPGLVVTAAATLACPHAAPAIAAPTQARVLLDGTPAVLLTDPTTVAGCPLVSAVPSTPCLTVTWMTGSTRVLVAGQPVVIQSSVGLAKNPAQAPQGPAVVQATQTRVTAS